MTDKATVSLVVQVPSVASTIYFVFLLGCCVILLSFVHAVLAGSEERLFAPSVQEYLYAVFDVAVAIAVPPAQMLIFLVSVNSGFGMTVTMALSFFVHPFAVAVTLNCVSLFSNLVTYLVLIAVSVCSLFVHSQSY